MNETDVTPTLCRLAERTGLLQALVAVALAQGGLPGGMSEARLAEIKGAINSVLEDLRETLKTLPGS